MPESQLPETSDGAVRNFIEAIALAFVSEAIAAFYRGEGAERVVGGLVVAALVSAAGFNWKKIRVAMGERFARLAAGVATDPRWWLAGLVIVFIYLGAPSLIREIRRPASSPTPSRLRDGGWLSSDEAINAFVPTAIRADLSQSSENLRQQLRKGQLIARAYSSEQGKNVQIPTEDWQFLGLVIRTGTTGGAVPGLSIEAGGAGLHYLDVELKQNLGSLTQHVPTSVV